MAEEVTTRYYRINENVGLFEHDNFKNKGFFLIEARYNFPESNRAVWSHSIIYYNNGSNIGTVFKVNSRGSLSITGLEDKIIETRDAVIELVGEIEELNKPLMAVQ